MKIKKVKSGSPFQVRFEAYKRHTLVGAALFTLTDDGLHLIVDSVFVKEKHRHQGIATALYLRAEKFTHRTLVDMNKGKSKDAKGLWSHLRRLKEKT